MSFIAIDLKVIEGLAANVARASGASEDRALAGLVRTWHRCWSDQIDTLTRPAFAGLFGGERLDEMIEALTSFGFLEPRGDGSWRVRGVGKYLRIQEGRVRGGKMASAAGNLKRGLKKGKGLESLGTFVSPQLPEKAPSLHPSCLPASAGDLARNPQLTPSLSPNTEHRTPNTIEASVAKKPATPVDPRLAGLTVALVSAYLEVRREKYRHGGAKDTQALKSLLPVATDAEILRRWRVGLVAVGWASCSTFAQLGSKWNDLAASVRSGPDPNGGIIRHETVPPRKPINLDEPTELPF